MAADLDVRTVQGFGMVLLAGVIAGLVLSLVEAWVLPTIRRATMRVAA
jgi:hypothetical protein